MGLEWSQFQAARPEKKEEKEEEEISKIIQNLRSPLKDRSWQENILAALAVRKAAMAGKYV